MTRRIGVNYIASKDFHPALDATAEQIQQAAARCAQAGLAESAGYLRGALAAV